MMCNIFIQLIIESVWLLSPNYLMIVQLSAILLKKSILAGLDQPMPRSVCIATDPKRYPDPSTHLALLS